MTFDHGFSSPRSIFFGNSPSKPSFFEFPRNIYKWISFKLDNFKTKPNNSPVIETLDITIKFKEFRKLLDDRKRALDSGILTDPREVKASIKHKNKTYKSTLRLKGDYSDHWDSIYRMSMRVKLKDASVLGLTRFSIQKNESRAFPYDQVFGELSKSIGNIAPYQTFARVNVNGEHWGIMNIEEHMSKEMLEKQHRKESLIFRFGSDLDSKYEKIVENEFNNVRFGDDRLNTNLYQEKKYLSDPHNRFLLSFISQNRLKKNTDNIFDIKKYTNSFSLATVWGNWHALSSMNSRNYLNPYTLKLEPITTDNGLPGDLNSIKDDNNLFSKKLFYPYDEIIVTNAYKKHTKKSIETVRYSLNKANDFREYYQSFFPLDENISLDILMKNFDFVKNNEVNHSQPYNKNKVGSNLSIPTVSQSKEFPVHVYFRHFTDGTVEVFNLLPDDVKIISIKNKNLLNPINTIIRGFKDGKYEPTVFKTDITGILDNEIQITTEYKGSFRKRKNGVSLFPGPYLNPLTDRTPINNDFIKKISSNHWVIKKGIWRIDKPLLIDGSLNIEAGTKLIFDNNSYLIVKGNLFARGTKNDRILLTTDSSWKGIYVMGVDKSESVLSYVDIKKTMAFSVGLLKLTGGINFYDSKVTISNTNIYATMAEDALNIVNSMFEIDGLHIDGTVSDAFDGDFSSGIVKNSLFTNIGGDAVDVSGSPVQVSDVKFKNVKDKALSVGEASQMTVKNLNMENVGVGIASKDGSQINASNIFIKNYLFKALMTYVKKDFYGQPSLLGKEIKIEPLKKNSFVAQKGTSMIINEKLITTTKLNVKDLYQSDTMKK